MNNLSDKQSKCADVGGAGSERGVAEAGSASDTDSAASIKTSLMRLQKFLARAGVASRRHSEELISTGHVRVNGKVVTKMGVVIDPNVDVVELDGVRLSLPKKATTLMLYKPLDYVSTMSDTHAKHSVSELVPCSACPGLFPVGRLDKDTTGLLLFSTDGQLGHKLLAPRTHVEKSYVALVEGKPSSHSLDRLRKGIKLDDGLTLPAHIEMLEGNDCAEALSILQIPKHFGRIKHASRSNVSKSHSILRIKIHEGKNRQIRRMFSAIGNPVCALHREAFGHISLGNLSCGAWRELSEREVKALRQACAESESAPAHVL